MTETLSVLLGLTLITVAILDMFLTVFMIGGGVGPQSQWAADRTWRLVLSFHRPESPVSHSWMRAAGPLIVLLVLSLWVMELTLGWALVFLPQAFLDPATATGFGDRLVFASHSVMGRSGNHPALQVSDGFWEFVQSMAGVTGVLVVSVGLAYVLPIVSAVAHKRAIAAGIATLGETVDTMYSLASTRGGAVFELYLVSLVSDISLCAERHRAYPVLHYFHSKDQHAALAPSIAKLCLLLERDLSACDRVDRTVTDPLKRAIENLMHALVIMGLARHAHTSSRVDSARLHRFVVDPRERNGIPTLPSHEWLQAYVEFDGWRWVDVQPNPRSAVPPSARSK